MYLRRIMSILLCAGLLSGCTNLLSKVPGSSQLTQMVQPRATEKDFEFIEDATLRKHMVAQANATAFRTRMMSSGLGATMVQEMEFKGAEFSMRSWQENETKKSAELVTIGDTTYLKDYKDNVWWKQTAVKNNAVESGPVDEVEPLDFKEEYSEMKDTTIYKSLGQEACGNLTCYKYEQSDSANPEGVRTFWFDVKDYLLRREESGYGEFSSSSLYEYEGITITEPTPTKNVPEGKSIYDYMLYEDAVMQGADKEELTKAMDEVKKMQEDFNAGEMPQTWNPEAADYSESYEEEVFQE